MQSTVGISYLCEELVAWTASTDAKLFAKSIIKKWFEINVENETWQFYVSCENLTKKKWIRDQKSAQYEECNAHLNKFGFRLDEAWVNKDNIVLIHLVKLM